MATLNPVQIAQVTYRAGFRGVDWIRSIAIALAESGGNPQAYNPESQSPYAKPGGGSRGLFQIFTSVHPEFAGMNLSDPQQNANAAYQLYKRAGGSFRDWTTYTQGVYNKYLSTAAAAASSTTGAVAAMAGKAPQQIGAGVTGTAGGFSAPGGFNIDSIVTGIKNSLLGKTARGEQREGLDAAFYLIGVILVLVGLVMLFVNSAPGQQVISLGGEAVKLTATKGLSKVL